MGLYNLPHFNVLDEFAISFSIIQIWIFFFNLTFQKYSLIISLKQKLKKFRKY